MCQAKTIATAGLAAIAGDVRRASLNEREKDPAAAQALAEEAIRSFTDYDLNPDGFRRTQAASWELVSIDAEASHSLGHR